MLKDLLEYVTPSMAAARIDNEGKVIKGVVLFGSKTSANGYTYSEKAVQRLYQFASGAKVYIDHESTDEARARQGVRSLQSFAGVVNNPQRSGDKILGDWHVTENYWPMARDIALMVPSEVGFSIAVKACTTKESGREIIADLHSLSSIDLVSKGATIANLFESLNIKREVKEPDKMIGTIIGITESTIAIDVGESEPLYIEKKKLGFIPRISQEVAITHSKIKKESKEEYMTITKEQLKEAVREGLKSKEDDEATILNAVKRDGHRESGLGSDTYHPHLDKDHFMHKTETKKDLSLDEDNVLGILTSK